MKPRSTKIDLPDFFRLGIYISTNFDFVDPANKKSIANFIGQQLRYFESTRRWLTLYRVNNIGYVKASIEKANSYVKSIGRHGHYIPESLEEPSYDFELKQGEFVVTEIKETDNTERERNNFHGYDDKDIIRIISEGGGEAHGYSK